MSLYQTIEEQYYYSKSDAIWWTFRHHRELIRMSFWFGLAANRSQEVLQVTPDKDLHPSIFETRSKCPVGRPFPAPHPGILLSLVTRRAQDKGDAVISWPCEVVCLTSTHNTVCTSSRFPWNRWWDERSVSEWDAWEGLRLPFLHLCLPACLQKNRKWCG